MVRPFARVLQTDVYEVANVLIGEPVYRAQTISAERDEPPIAKDPQLVADARLADACDRSQIAHAKLLASEGIQYPQTGWIGQCREDRRSPIDLSNRDEGAANALYSIAIDDLGIASIIAGGYNNRVRSI